jgi:hypothetical protein
VQRGLSQERLAYDAEVDRSYVGGAELTYGVGKIVGRLVFQSAAFGISGHTQGSSSGEFADASGNHRQIEVIGIE